ncbi:MAG: hypothetical protein KDD60_06280 [Bdellovibrionales bacterium]|nr:hypothetical protein [Bdellovibrionales bacterium]
MLDERDSTRNTFLLSLLIGALWIALGLYIGIQLRSNFVYSAIGVLGAEIPAILRFFLDLKAARVVGIALGMATITLLKELFRFPSQIRLFINFWSLILLLSVVAVFHYALYEANSEVERMNAPTYGENQ